MEKQWCHRGFYVVQIRFSFLPIAFLVFMRRGNLSMKGELLNRKVITNSKSFITRKSYLQLNFIRILQAFSSNNSITWTCVNSTKSNIFHDDIQKLILNVLLQMFVIYKQERFLSQKNLFVKRGKQICLHYSWLWALNHVNHLEY